MQEQDYLNFAKDLAEKAGEIMRKNFMLGMTKEWKQDNTPLTVTDTAINELVIQGVKAKFPDHGVLGEEDSFATDKEMLWVVDPVDGTMPFSHGVPASTFSLALVKNGQPIVAAVEEPFIGRTYWATKGGGAFVNGDKLRVNDQEQLGPQVFIDIDARFVLDGFDSLAVMRELAASDVRVSKSFSVVYYSLPVVSGNYAACVAFIEYPWDGAAISLIATEAGGKVTDLHGKERRWDEPGSGFIVSNGRIHDTLLDILKRTRLS